LKPPQLWKKQNAALLFPQLLWISRAKTVLGLSTVPTSPTAINQQNQQRNKRRRFDPKSVRV
jgi:hypothetical protein